MTELKADYFDGQSSRRQEVTLLFSGEQLQIRGPELNPPLSFPLGQVRIRARIGTMPRLLHLPNGAECQTREHDAIDAILRQHRRGLWSLLAHRLESRTRYVLLALTVAFGATWLALEQGLPWLAQQVVANLPPNAQAGIGQQSLELMDKSGLFTYSTLKTTERSRLLRLFIRLSAPLPDSHRMRLEFRASRGANAYTLPSGIVVVTDSLARLALNDDELLAIMAHEFGHVVHNHSLRLMLQNSAVTLLLMAWTGDIHAMASVASGLPTLLMHLKYSRDFETEADHYAMDYLRNQQIPLTHYANALRTLRGKQEAPSSDYLSTHPDMEKRIEAVLERAKKSQ